MACISESVLLLRISLCCCAALNSTFCHALQKNMPRLTRSSCSTLPSEFERQRTLWELKHVQYDTDIVWWGGDYEIIPSHCMVGGDYTVLYGGRGLRN